MIARASTFQRLQLQLKLRQLPNSFLDVSDVRTDCLMYHPEVLCLRFF